MVRLPSLSITALRFKLPWVGEVDLTPDDTERRAAWALYVELVTRVSVQSLADDGLLREALASLHSLFGTTRAILREAGPGVGARRDSVGGIAIRVLNEGLRPTLVHWHPMLAAYEAGRPTGMAPGQHEAAWEHAPALRGEMARLREALGMHAHALGVIAGVEEVRPADDGAAAARDARAPMR